MCNLLRYKEQNRNLFSMKNILISLMVVCALGTTHAQQYNTAFGVRGDWSNLDIDLAQLTVKHYFHSPHGLETNVGFGNRYIWMQFMYHQSHDLTSEFDGYWGAGPDVGYWNRNYGNRYDPATTAGWWSGVTGCLGIEYTFVGFPINLACDIGPSFRVVPDRQVALMIGFNCRYAFR